MSAGRPSESPGHDRSLSADEKRHLAVLALPTTALALAITVVSTYLGAVARRYTQQTVLIGLIVGSEGIMALWIPLIAGAWSDRLHTRIGGRLPFLLAGGIPAAVALACVGFLHSLAGVAIATAFFFAFYFVAYEPYRALYPDLVGGQAIAGRAQSAQAVARGTGTGLALLGGGLLLSLARPLPFLVAAVLLVAALLAFSRLLLRSGAPQERGEAGTAPELARRLRRLIAAGPLRDYLIANALWETALSALKTFVILYLTVGLGYHLSTASLFVGGVAVVILLGAAAAGSLGDRLGRLRVLNVALLAYGCGFILLVLTTSRPLMAISIPFVAIGGGTVMTLAYAVLIPLMPRGEHGALTGFYSLSRGIGNIAGPILAGAAITLTQGNLFASSHGFQATWAVCAAAAFGSMPFVARLRRHQRQQGDDR